MAIIQPLGPLGIPRSICASDRRREMVRGPLSLAREPFSLSVTGAALKAQLAKRIAEDRAWCEREEARLRNQFKSAMQDGYVDLVDAVENETAPPRTVLEEEAETIAFHEFLLTVLADDERYVMTYDELRSLLAPFRAPWSISGRGCP